VSRGDASPLAQADSARLRGQLGSDVEQHCMISTDFDEKGYEFVPDVFAESESASLASELETAATKSGGTRTLLRERWCRVLACTLRDRLSLIPSTHVAVQCTYFEKSAFRNWLVPIHQDLSIPVAERVGDESLSGWSEKEGAIFVQPPVSVLEALVAVRVHVDACAAEDGPIRVVPGSHRFGRIGAQQAPEIRRVRGEVVCEATVGSVLAMRPLLLHSSMKTSGASMRRVLHFVFGPAALPCGLEWRDAV